MNTVYELKAEYLKAGWEKTIYGVRKKIKYDQPFFLAVCFNTKHRVCIEYQNGESIDLLFVSNNISMENVNNLISVLSK